MVLCVALVVRGLPFLFQLRPKFGPIPDQLLFYRLCLAPVALPFSCRGGGLAERGKFRRTPTGCWRGSKQIS